VLISVKAEKAVPRAHGHEWAVWRFDERRLFLDYRPNDYNIPLQTSDLSMQVLNWIGNVHSKSWASHDVLIELLMAYREIFSRSRKFAGPFEAEIPFRKGRWDGFRSEVANLELQLYFGKPGGSRELYLPETTHFRGPSGPGSSQISLIFGSTTVVLI
jgi:hypothetical protein